MGNGRDTLCVLWQLLIFTLQPFKLDAWCLRSEQLGEFVHLLNQNVITFLSSCYDDSWEQYPAATHTHTTRYTHDYTLPTVSEPLYIDWHVLQRTWLSTSRLYNTAFSEDLMPYWDKRGNRHWNQRRHKQKRKKKCYLSLKPSVLCCPTIPKWTLEFFLHGSFKLKVTPNCTRMFSSSRNTCGTRAPYGHPPVSGSTPTTSTTHTITFSNSDWVVVVFFN